MRPILLAVTALAAAGCITPHSMTLGQMAAPIGRGATEVGVFSGVQFGSQTNPPQASVDGSGNAATNQVSTSGLLLPGAEANVQHGFNDRFALNVHASAAGLQPGLKWTLNRSRQFHFALLPAIALGFGSLGTTTFQSGSDGLQKVVATQAQNSLIFLGGLKVLFSHKAGFYAGLGYDFVYNRAFSQSSVVNSGITKVAAQTSAAQHQVMAAVGFDIPLGMVHLRPEVAFALTPYTSMTWTTQTDGSPSLVTSGGGGYGFMVLPGFTIAIATPARAPDPDEDEADSGGTNPDKASGDGESDDDDDEKPKAKKKRPAPLTTDDDEERPSNNRRKRASPDDED